MAYGLPEWRCHIVTHWYSEDSPFLFCEAYQLLRNFRSFSQYLYANSTALPCNNATTATFRTRSYHFNAITLQSRSVLRNVYTANNVIN